jgi:phage gpG-like protein
MEEVDTRLLIAMLRQLVISETKRNFRDETDPWGHRWEPLKRPRRNSKGNDKILQDHGVLRASVTARGARGNVERHGPQFLEWGTNIDYAPYHQDGTRKMVARKFLGVGPALRRKIDHLVEHWTEEQLARMLHGGG